MQPVQRDLVPPSAGRDVRYFCKVEPAISPQAYLPVHFFIAVYLLLPVIVSIHNGRTANTVLKLGKVKVDLRGTR